VWLLPCIDFLLKEMGWDHGKSELRNVKRRVPSVCATQHVSVIIDTLYSFVIILKVVLLPILL
jgi:hypothetical protein